MAAAPGNNNFTNALAVTGASGSVAVSTIGATKEALEPAHAGNGGGASVWYQWTALTTGSLTLSTAGSDFDTVLAVYAGTNLASLVGLAANDDDPAISPQSRLQLNLTAGQTYRIAVDGYDGVMGTAVLSWTFLAAPTNDNFSAAQVITGRYGTVANKNLAATREANEPFHSGNVGGHSVWFRWVAPASGPTRFSTFGSGFDTVLGVYTGDAVNALTLVAEDDDIQPGLVSTSQVDFTAVAGTNYLIAVDGFGGAVGYWRLSWQDGVPTNDNFAGALVLASGGGTYQDCNLLATSETNEPAHGGNIAGQSLWFSWTALTDGTNVCNTYGSRIDTTLAVYTGTNLTNLTVVAQNDDASVDTVVSRAVFNATAGVTYRIAVDGRRRSGFVSEGFVQLNWFRPPATNDMRTNATVLAGNTGNIAGGNFAATLEPGELSILAQPGGRSIWYAWTPDRRGVATLSTEGSALDTLLGVYRASGTNQLIVVAESDDIDPDADFRQSRVAFPADGGVTYLIAVDGYAGEEGAIQLAWNLVPSPLLVSASADCFSNQVTVTFTERLSSPGNTTNYQISGGILVNSAALVGDGHVVSLFTDPLTPGISNILSVVSVPDLAGNIIPLNSQTTFVRPSLPVISIPPLDAAVCSPNTAIFVVGASGTAPLSYQWRNNGAILAGATNSAYMTGTAGSYSVVVANTCGSVTSAPAILTVSTNPVITCPVDITTNILGSNVVVNFTPTVSDGALQSCVPASGSAFSLGTTSVVCTATNASCTSTCTFNLSVIPIVPRVGKTWNGGGTNNNWTTSSNWNAAVAAGDSLFFAGTTRLSPSNDFPAGTVFSNLTFDSGGGAFALLGNAIPLTGSITNNQAISTVRIGLDLLPTANGFIHVVSNGVLSATGVVSSAFGFIKTGPGVLNVRGTNTFTGAVVVAEGTLQVDNNFALGVTNAPTTVNSGASLNLAAPDLTANLLHLGGEQIFVSGVGVDGLGAILNSSTVAQQNALQRVTLLGDTTFGGRGRWDIRGTLATALLSTGGQPYNLTKTGTNQVSLFGVAVDPALGNIDIQQGVLSIQGNTTSLGNPTSTLTVQQGATLQFLAATNRVNKNFVLTGDGVADTVDAASGNNTMIGLVTLVKDCGFRMQGVTTLTNRGPIGGSGGLIKTGGGTLVLTATNTYTGNTRVSVATLILSGTGSISNSPIITLSPTGTNLAILNASGRTDRTLVVNSGQTLKGNGSVLGRVTIAAGAVLAPGDNAIGTLTLNSNLTLAGIVQMEINRTNTPDSDLVAGISTNAYGGTLMVMNMGPALQAGDCFTLFTATNYTGSFVTTNLPSLGTGLAWDTTGLALNGSLCVVALPPIVTAQPQSQTIFINGSGSFRVTASGVQPFSYQWRFNGSSIPGGTNATFVVNNAQTNNAGDYSAIVFNVGGSVTSQVATLTVLLAPTSAPVIPELVLHLPFNNNLTDATGRGNNGVGIQRTQNTSNNVAPTFVPDGQLGQALHYESDFGPPGTPGQTTTTNSSYVTLGVRPDLQFSSNVNFTVAFWIRLPLDFMGGDLPFFGNAAGSLGNQGFVFSPAYGYGNGSGANPDPAPLNYGGWGMSLYDAGGTNGARYYGDLGSINDGSWHHLAFAFDRNAAVAIYLDGAAANSTTISGTTTAVAKNIDSGLAATIGQDPTGLLAETGSGDIDDLGVWKRALTPTEIASLYLAGLNGLSFVGTSPPFTISVAKSGSLIVLRWDVGVLQEATTVGGPYTTVPGATSPFSITPSAPKKYYRTQL